MNPRHSGRISISMAMRVLCVVTDGFEEIEMITPVDLLRRAEVEVVIASLAAGPATGRCGVKVMPDKLLWDVDAADFDLLFLPGGPGVKELRKDGRAATLAAEFVAAGKTVAAICAAPLVLHDAGLLAGRRFTAHDSTWADLPGVEDARVLQDGPVVTSRGAGTALDFGLALVGLLAGEKARADVSAAIMA